MRLAGLGLVFGRATHPLPGIDIEVVDVGGWLADCDELLEFGCDFLMVAEHRRRSHMMGMREWELSVCGELPWCPPRISRPMLVWGGFLGAWFWLVLAGLFMV